MNTHKHILVFISSSITLFGLFWICTFGDWHTVNALGDDSSIYLVDFDETAYDLYLKGYYPSDYTYADFRRDSIESMTSHYVATDSNNFSAIVDTIEQDVLQNGWSVIDNFFENAWINLKTGDITVTKGFTDDFKHSLDGRFKTAPSGGGVIIGSGNWQALPYTALNGNYVSALWFNGVQVSANCYATNVNGTNLICSYALNSDYGSDRRLLYKYTPTNEWTTINGTWRTYDGYIYGYFSSQTPNVGGSQYTSIDSAVVDFYGNSPSSDPVWNGSGYYSDTPADYSINLPALPFIDWPSISTNNKTKYGVDFPDVNLSVDFQLPDSYYPQTVIYDVPYWLYNTDSTPVDWQNVSFDDVTLPEVQLTDGDGSFFQALFNTLPLAFVPILLGVILCYLIFLML